MKQELENQVPVAEQVSEIESVDEAIKTEYLLASDGTIEQVGSDIENPEGTGA